jgi:hypothetical protein
MLQFARVLPLALGILIGCHEEPLPTEITSDNGKADMVSPDICNYCSGSCFDKAMGDSCSNVDGDPGICVGIEDNSCTLGRTQNTCTCRLCAGIGKSCGRSRPCCRVAANPDDNASCQDGTCCFSKNAKCYDFEGANGGCCAGTSCIGGFCTASKGG